jgi:hypothetical protein
VANCAPEGGAVLEREREKERERERDRERDRERERETQDGKVQSVVAPLLFAERPRAE